MEFAAETFGGLDILVNNAALTTRGDIEHVSLEVVDSMLSVNLRAPLLLTQAAIPHFERAAAAAIVNIGSVNAYIGEPKLCVYSVSKGGLMTLTKNCAAYAEPLPDPREPDQRRLDADRRRGSGQAPGRQGRRVARRGRRARVRGAGC